MTPASYLDLCIDAVDPVLLGRFWAALLDRQLRQREDGVVELTAPGRRDRVWVNPVPEPVTVKQRVHLDVHVAAHQDALALGARPVDLTSYRWQVLADPEGGELCVFERERVPAEPLYELVVDCADPRALAQWWGEVVGGRIDHGDGISSLEEVPGAPFEYVVFVAVPEPKTVKNRIHWDVTAPAVEALTERGATVLAPPHDGLVWTTLADPEGNEFCAFPPD